MSKFKQHSASKEVLCLIVWYLYSLGYPTISRKRYHQLKFHGSLLTWLLWLLWKVQWCSIIQNITMLFTCIQKLQLPLSNIWVSILFLKQCSPTGDPIYFHKSQAYTIIQQYEYFLIISLFILFGNCCIILILHSKVSFTIIIGT